MLFLRLSGFYFFYFAAIGVYIIFLPKVLHDIGYSTIEIGIILALAPLMRFITPFLFLKHINLTQKLFKNILIASAISSFLFYFTIEHFYFFMLNNAILGVFLSVILPYVELISVRELKNKYGKSRLFGSIGFALIGLVLAKYSSETTIVLHYYFISTLLTVIIAFGLSKYDEKENLKCEQDENFSLLRFWPFWASLFFMQVSFGGYYNFFTIYENDHGISLETISYLWSAAIFFEILMFYFQAPLLKNNLIFIIKFSILATAFRWLLLYLFPSSLLVSYFSQSIHAFSFGLYHSAVILYLYKIYQNKKLAQQFMLGIAYGFGGFIGALIAGYLYGSYLFLVSSLLSLISFIFIFRIDREKSF